MSLSFCRVHSNLNAKGLLVPVRSWLQADWIQISLVTGITCPRCLPLVENEQSWQQIESLISPSNGWFVPSGHVDSEEYEILEINDPLWNFIRAHCSQFIVFLCFDGLSEENDYLRWLNWWDFDTHLQRSLLSNIVKVLLILSLFLSYFIIALHSVKAFSLCYLVFVSFLMVVFWTYEGDKH